MRPSSRVNHAILIMTRFACTSMIWKPNSKACQGASNLYGLFKLLVGPSQEQPNELHLRFILQIHT